MNEYLHAAALVDRRAPQNWSQRVGPLSKLPPLLHEYGIDTASLLDNIGLAPDALSDPENRVPYIAVLQLLAESARLTGCDHFALLAFRQCRLADLGVIGELARNCATVGEALSTLTAYQQLNAESGAVYLLQETNTIAMGYAVFHPGVIDAHLAQEAVMAIIANVVRELAGYEADFVKLDLPRFSPPDSTPYQQYFHCPLRFNAQRAALRLPLSLMSRPVIGANENLKRQLLQQAERQLEPAFESQLYRSLSSLLMTGLPPASGDAVAQQFAMHRRTFNRRLMAMGTTFQSVLDDVRFNVARQLLRETLLPITEIALTLGYSESSAFGRAFRRWSGQTPRDWRDIEQGQ